MRHVNERARVGVLLALLCGMDLRAGAQEPPARRPEPARAPVLLAPVPPPTELARPAVPDARNQPAVPSIEDFVQRPVSTYPLTDPRSAREVESFVESLRGNDSAIDVVVGQGRILTTQADITQGGQNQPLIAVGDPSVVDFNVVSPRQIRIHGQRIGVTDLSVTTAGGETYSFEIRVVADLSLLRGKLKAIYPDASIRLGQLRDHVIVEGEARDVAQVNNIIATIQAYLRSVEVGQLRRVQAQQGGLLAGGMLGGAGIAQPGAAAPTGEAPTALGPGGIATPELAAPLQIQGTVATPQIINLLRVPSSQQVMLKVRIAELNRTALRRIGSNFLGVDPSNGAIVGSQIAQPIGAFAGIGEAAASPITPGFSLNGAAAVTAGSAATVFGIFQDANFMFTLNALRRVGMLKILAEPNLVAMHGQYASFLAGGEFPVPVPQVAASGVAPAITVQFKQFGVQLGFLPFILDEGVIRLTVTPEVSNIDFAIAVTLVAGGSPVPGLNTRRAQTTVELKEGQTLAIAGLLQLNLRGNLDRIPGLGDLPVLGPFFSNNESERIEKELVVLVTPYLIEPMNPDQVPPGPGDEVNEPNDLEFYFLGRIEGRTGVDFRSTTQWDDPYHMVRALKLESKYIKGPVGFSQ
jgi:pilus assembly protein CpaC